MVESRHYVMMPGRSWTTGPERFAATARGGSRGDLNAPPEQEQTKCARKKPLVHERFFLVCTEDNRHVGRSRS